MYNNETTALLTEAAQEVNIRPLSRNPWPWGEQPELGPPQREQHVPQQPQKEQPRAELLQKFQLPQGAAACGKTFFFFIMYFSLPDSIPPRPLGEARVRKQ